MKTGTKVAVNVWGRSKLHQMRQPVCLLGFGAVGEEFVSTFISMLNPPLVTYCTQLSVEKASFSVNVYFLGREVNFSEMLNVDRPFV